MGKWLAGLPHIAEALRAQDAPVSVVGGAVRDALLGRPHGKDVDVVVEGDALPVARDLGRRLGAFVVEHPRFGTASLELPHGGEIDVVTARREIYPSPGALPVVTPGSLADDLARRDFTVNAVAYRVTGPHAGDITDPHGGLADLRGAVIRALRPGSFAEDPSRVVRAARYAARLGFALDPATAAEAAEEAPRLRPDSARVADELARALREDTAAAALDILAGLGCAWIDADGAGARFAAISGALASPGAPPLEQWALRLGAGVRPGVMGALAVPGWASALAVEYARGAELAHRLDGDDLAASRVDEMLRATPPATAAGALAHGARGVAEWWRSGRDVRLAIRGADLVAAGVPPGPRVGAGLRAARAALLDGHAPGRDEQLAVALTAAGHP